jgi:hypothetical protein
MSEGREHPLRIVGGLLCKGLKFGCDGWGSQGISRLSVQRRVMPGVAFPPVGRLGLASPPSWVLCVATTATLPLSWPFACRSRPGYLAGFSAFVVSLTGSWSGRSSPTTPGLLVARSPIPGL